MRLGFSTPRLEFDENGHVQPVLGVAKIREPGICWRTVAGRESAEANRRSSRASIAARWRYATGAGEIGHIGRPMVVLPTERNMLARHPVKCSGHVPSLVRIARILREVGRSRGSRGAVDRRQQDQIPPRIIDLSAANRHTVLVSIEPEPIVDHVTQKALLGTLRRIAGAADASTMLASHISGKREGGFVQESFWVVEVFDLNAIVRVIAHTAWRVQGILTQRVLISQDR